MRFKKERQRLCTAYCLKDDWWAHQPRVTSKSGWVTFDADPDPQVRVRCQIAACQLGIQICEAFREEEPDHSDAHDLDPAHFASVANVMA